MSDARVGGASEIEAEFVDSGVSESVTPDSVSYTHLDVYKRQRPLCFATNNASRTPGEVATQLRSLGLTVEDAAVVTSAQAGAQLLAAELPSGSAVLAVGGPGVPAALAAVGLVVTREPEPVSYTHLDVYKRQVPILCARRKLEKGCP